MTTNISRDNSKKKCWWAAIVRYSTTIRPQNYFRWKIQTTAINENTVQIRLKKNMKSDMRPVPCGDRKSMDSRIRQLRSRCQTSHTISIFALCVPRHSRAAESIREHWIKLLPLRSACIRKATHPSWRENTWILNKHLCPHRLTHKIDEWQVVMYMTDCQFIN